MDSHKIVLIDDDEVTVRMYTLQFASPELTLLTAPNGQEGLALVKKEKPDLVLLDLKLPDMEGFEVLKALKADARLKSIPVMVFSNAQKTSNAEKALKLGAVEFVMKTKVLPNEMANKIKAYLFNK